MARKSPISRRTIVKIHLYLAAFFAPALLLVAISGGAYLAGIKGQVQTTPIPLPADVSLDFDSPSLEDDVRALLQAQGLRTNFAYIKNRGNVLQLRPTSRKYYQITKTPTGITLSDNEPNFQAAIMELHKGHGPKLFKLYQKFLAAGLIFIVLSGFWLGMTAPLLRKKTLTTTGIGLVVFIVLAVFL